LHGDNATEASLTSQLSKIQVSKLLKDLEPLLEPWNRYTSLKASLSSTAPLLNDPEDALRALAEDETSAIKAEMEELVEKMRWLLLKRETSGMENVGAMVEIKAGAGGEEAALFVGELMRMYLRYADIWGEEISSRGGRGNDEWRGGGGWKTSMVSESVSATSTGRTGFKEVTFEVKGRGAYETFRWETGVHRVQRVPLTETSGRMHTSAVAVVVRAFLSFSLIWASEC
jgi:peptide chain release factor 1